MSLTLPQSSPSGRVLGLLFSLFAANSPAFAETGAGSADRPLVTVTPVEMVHVAPEISRHTTVKSRTKRSLFAPVSGQILWVSDMLEPGHLHPTGAVLARLDPIPFETAVAEAQAQLAASDLNLLLEERSAKLARNRRAGTEVSQTAPLVLREPYLNAARLRRDADKVALDQAQADLTKLQLQAPFPSMILSHKLYPGAYVSAGEALAQVISAGDLIVDLALTREEWAQLLPRGFDDMTNLPLVGKITTDQGAKFVATPERILATADDFTKQPVLRLRVELPQPQMQSLLPGAFVAITLQGTARQTLLKTPSSALTFDNRVLYVLPEDNRLRDMTITAHFERDGFSYLPQGSLPENAQVLISPLASYQAGTAVTTERDTDG